MGALGVILGQWNIMRQVRVKEASGESSGRTYSF